MRAVLWVGGLIVFGFVILIVVPSFTLLSSGTATLTQIHDTAILGTATLTPTQGGQTTVVDVQVQQLEPNTTYALSIRSGSCYGTILTALQPAVTDFQGKGSSSTTLGAQLQSTWFIVLHDGPTTKDDILACGQVVINTVVQSSTPTNISPIIPGQFPNTGGGPPRKP